MKKMLFSAVAAIALLSPIAATTAFAQGEGRRGEQSQQGEYQNPSVRDQDGDARRGDHRDRREAWRDNRADAQWDDSRYNGYYENNRWTYGPPPSDRGRNANVTLGYQPWAAGQRLGYYNGRFAEVSYRAENLRQPRRGYQWVRDDRGDYLLVSQRTGVISQVVVNDRSYRDGRRERRDGRREARWNEREHNGYYSNNTWRYGPPPEAQYGRPGFALGYRPWVSGQRLGYFNGRYEEVHYRDRNLREPPRGYHWVRDDRGDLLLAAIVGGLITQVIVNSAN